MVLLCLIRYLYFMCTSTHSQQSFCIFPKTFSACASNSSFTFLNLGLSGATKNARHVLSEYAAGPNPRLNSVRATACVRPAPSTNSRSRSLLLLMDVVFVFMYTIIPNQGFGEPAGAGAGAPESSLQGAGTLSAWSTSGAMQACFAATTRAPRSAPALG